MSEKITCEICQYYWRCYYEDGTKAGRGCILAKEQEEDLQELQRGDKR